MKKISLWMILILCILTGCENQEEQAKSEYIAVKSNLLSTTDYVDELPVDIIVSIDRVEEEKITYQVRIENPKENMHKIKAMVVHNYNNEDVFPTVGLFDEVEELLVADPEENKLELTGTIESAKNISKLDLQLKVWLEYIDDSGETKNIYYRT